VHYVLTTVLDKLDVRNNFWDVTYCNIKIGHKI